MLSNTERCWYVRICDWGAFWKYHTSEASVVFSKSAEITNVYIHSRVWYDLYHMPFVRKVVDNLDSLNFAYYKSFPTVAIKTSPNFITYHQRNRDVRVRNKQSIARKLCMLVLTLKGYLGIWYKISNYTSLTAEWGAKKNDLQFCIQTDSVRGAN